MIPGKRYSPQELLWRAWSRHTWLVLVSFVVGATAAVVVASRLPERYRAETLILAASQSVSPDYVRNTVATTEPAKDRLPSISQQILSRTRLERIIRDLKLYEDALRTKPMEVVVDQMRANIEVKTVEGSESFRISFEADTPLVAMRVTERLGGLFIEENVRDRKVLAQDTSAFLASQLEDARTRLVDQEKRLEAYRLRYGPELPTQLQSNIQVIQNTQAQLQTLGEGINRDHDRRLLIARQLADMESEQFLAEPGAVAGSSSQVISVSAQLEAALAELNSLELRLTPEHPDLIRAKRAVAELVSRVERETGGAQNAGANFGASKKPLTASEIARRNKVRELQVELESLDRQVADKVVQQGNLRAALQMYQARVEAVPTRESELASLTRDYDTLQTLYRSLLSKKEESRIAENLESRQVSEQFKILDAPHRPERPFRPNRPLIDLLGGLGGLAFGIGVAVLLEYGDRSLNEESDVHAVLDLPVLALIPAIPSRMERRRARWRRLAFSAALVATFGTCATALYLTFRL